MTNLKPQHSSRPSAGTAEISLAELRGDCARMAPHWAACRAAHRAAPVSPSLIHGVDGPAASARLVDAMSEYGD